MMAKIIFYMDGSSATAIFSALNVKANLYGSQRLCRSLNVLMSLYVFTPDYDRQWLSFIVACMKEKSVDIMHFRSDAADEKEKGCVTNRSRNL